VDGFVHAIGNGLVGLVEGSFNTIGAVLRGMVNQVTAMVPGPLLFVLVGGGLTALAWTLAKR
jgi:hypothetical protein